MAHRSCDSHVRYNAWQQKAGSHKNPGIPSKYLMCPRLQSLNGFTCETAKVLPINLAKVQILNWIAVGRNLESWWRYEAGLVLWQWELLYNMCLWQSAVMAKTCVAKARSGLVSRCSIGEWRNWLLPFGHTTVQGFWMLPKSLGSHHQMFCCNPSWHVVSWSRHWDVWTWGWVLMGITSKEMLMILYPAMSMSSTRNHSVSNCSGDWLTSDHSNCSWTNVARSCFLRRTDLASTWEFGNH